MLNHGSLEANRISESATVTTSLDEVCTINVENCEKIGVDIAVTTAALDQFAILGKMHPGGTYQTLFNAAVDFTNPSGLMVGASGDLTTQSVGSGWFIMDCDGLSSIQIKAASGTTTSGVAVKASAK